MKSPFSNSQDEDNLGYLRGFAEEYNLGKKLGKGGSGTVFVATRRSDNCQFAVKVIPKVLTDPNYSERKRALQIPSIRREVEVLLSLRGTLDVATLEGAYEDSKSVYLVMELCRGGELLGKGGLSGGNKRSKQPHHPYTERAVASYMRSILRTIAQCHARSIIHRDIKPENFLLLTTEDSSPIKAIDFGLADFFTPESLPLTAPNVEGTPWYLAPEACRAKWYPATDVWAAGVICAYMLTGVYPFVDRICPDMPDLARTLKVICYEELNTSGPEWEGVSTEAVEFVRYMLVKDPAQRPSATDALAHSFLQDHPSRVDRPLHHSVVQRIQRFAQNGVFKRRVLEHIARDLVSMHFGGEGERSVHGGAVFADRSVRGARALQEASRHGPSSGNTSRDPSTSFRFASMLSRKKSTAAQAAQAGEGSRSKSRRGSFRGFGGGGGSTRGGIGSSMRGANGYGASIPAGVYLPVSTPYSRRLAVLLDSLDPDSDGKVERKDLQGALQKMGYKLDEREAGELFDAVDVERKGVVLKSDISASLVDWKWVQDTFADRWVESVQRVFQGLDKDGDGELDAQEIAAAFGGQLCPYEVDAAVHEALLEAMGHDQTGAEGADGDETKKDQDGVKIDFQHLLQLLQSGSGNADLMLFDDRLSEHSSRHFSGNIDDLMAAEKRGIFSCCFSG